MIYIHVADDGGVLVIDGDTGKSAWVTEPELMRRVENIRDRDGSILLSTKGESPLATQTVESLRAVGIRIVSATEIHPDATRSEGLTTLMFAAYAGAVDLVDDLLRRGAETESQDADGYTPLMYAANGGQDISADLLIKAGAELNRADREGSTALMFAAQHGFRRIVRRLLTAGAIPSYRRKTA